MRTKTLAAAAAAALVIAGGSYAYGATTAAPATPISTLTFCQSNDGEMKAVAASSACPKGTTKYTLSGVAGPAGSPGAPGAQGPAGVKGDPGIAGIDGVPGTQGPKGDPGVSGADGAVGPQGPAGVQGDPGVTGADGAVGPQGLAGPKGDSGPAGSGIVTLDSLKGSPCRVGLPGEGTTSVSYPRAGFATQEATITCVANAGVATVIYSINAPLGLSADMCGDTISLAISGGATTNLQMNGIAPLALAAGDQVSVPSFSSCYWDTSVGNYVNYSGLTASGVCTGTYPAIVCDPLKPGDNLVTFDLS